MKGGSHDGAAVIRADNRPSKEAPGNPGGRQFPNGEKQIYARLTPEGTQTEAPPVATPLIGNAGQNPNSLEDRIEQALKRAQNSGGGPMVSPAPASGGADRPTVVRSEQYRPDGTRVDGTRPTVTPSLTDLNSGQLPPPFGNGAPSSMTPVPPPAPFRPASIPPTAPAAPSMKAAPIRSAALTASAPPEPAPPVAAATGSGYFVSLKSAPDEKAIQRDIPGLSDKFKAVLGDVQISTKVADLGAKGVTYRAVAGPLGSKQEAADLCNKIKGSGGSCFVTN